MADEAMGPDTEPPLVDIHYTYGVTCLDTALPLVKILVTAVTIIYQLYLSKMNKHYI